MQNNIAVITTFPTSSWKIYAEKMLQSFVQFWPAEVPLLVQVDDDLLVNDINKILRPQDGLAAGRLQDHEDFLKRNSGKDDPQNYRMQPNRFCHKVFALYRAYNGIVEAKKNNISTPRYLIWMDADVHTIGVPTNLIDCLPKEGDAVSYLGRKDWDHSECGWLAFDLDNKGGEIIEALHKVYVDDTVLTMAQQHDSYVFDEIKKPYKCTNLTEGKPGMDIWPHSPMGAWSIHHKGPVAKDNLSPHLSPHPIRPIPGQNFVIQTKNAIPNEQISAQIEENQKLIKNWLIECKPTKEELIVVSAGPSLIPEDVQKEVDAGKKIVAVKHALQRLKTANITPWACILLDPRPHVADFVKDADPKVKWFVASQVNPEVTRALLAKGCEVWGYHASVGAGEDKLTLKQADSIINGGSATATRGLYLLYHMGFRNFNLYGYDLSLSDKPDLNLKDEYGQAKYLEFSVGAKNALMDMKRNFYSEPQLIAQFEEIQAIINAEKMKLKAYGYGMVPFVLKLTELTHLRQAKLKCNIKRKPKSYKRLFLWTKIRKTRLYRTWLAIYKLIRLKHQVRNRSFTDSPKQSLQEESKTLLKPTI